MKKEQQQLLDNNFLPTKIRYNIKVAEKNKKRTDSLRSAVFTFFGNKCMVCGVSDPVVLTIDHIQPCGKNREHIGVMYKKILKNPDEARLKYQLLCRNCNWKKCIENNEHQQRERPFAYQHELDILESRIQVLEKKLFGKPQSNKKHIAQELVEDNLIPINEIFKDSPVSLTTLNDMLKRGFIEKERINNKIYVKRESWEEFKAYETRHQKTTVR